MRRFSVLLCVLLSLFAFCSCQGNPEQTQPVSLEQPAYIRYPGTDWDMTPAEFFEALNLSLEDFTLTETTQNDCRVSYYVGEATDYFGETVTMQARFSSLPYDEIHTLSKVILTYNRSMDNDQFMGYCKRLYRLVKNEGALLAPTVGRKVTDPLWMQLYSAETTSDFSNETKERLNAVCRHYVPEKTLTHGAEDYLQILGKRALSHIQIICPDQTPQLLVIFSGDAISTGLRYLTLYDDLPEK